MTSTELTTHADTPKARQLLATVRDNPEFAQQLAMVLPPDIPVQKFIRTFGTALLADPELASKAKPDSIVRALLRAAQDGLMPDGNEAAIAVYSGEAQYLPMIGGYRKDAARSGWSIRTVVVFENDDFSIEQGTDAKIVHRPVRPGQPKGKPIGAYAIGAHIDGRREQEWMDEEQILKRRAVAKTKKVWETWPDRMWEKTVGKALYKKLPLDDSDRQQRMLLADELEQEDRLRILYGGAATRPALTPGRATGPVEDRGTDGIHSPDPQAGDASLPDASPAPDEPEPEFVPTADVDPTQDTLLQQHADEAGMVEAPRTAGSGYSGKSIYEIAHSEHGIEWLQWAIDPERKWNKETSENYVFGQALVAYLGYYHPELLPNQEG